MDFIHQVARPQTELAAVAGRGMQETVHWVADKYARRTSRPAPLKELEQFAMQAKGLPFSLYRTHRSLSMQGSYAAASDIGAHHAAAWLIKVDLLGAFPTLADKARALITYPRVRLGNDNLGLCKLPWVDVFNPESKERKDTDIYINPASQEIYAELYNGMLGTELTWEQIFEQTDRDINLQRVMNALVFQKSPGDYDWLPDRAIGPTDDDLYLAEREYNDQEVARFLGKPVEEVANLITGEKRDILMTRRKEALRQLIDRYYRERGWTAQGIPRPETLQGIGLWDYLTAEAREKISTITAA
jgi:aldehyde:ferredoxin oxidoreductase